MVRLKSSAKENEVLCIRLKLYQLRTKLESRLAECIDVDCAVENMFADLLSEIG